MKGFDIYGVDFIIWLVSVEIDSGYCFPCQLKSVSVEYLIHVTQEHELILPKYLNKKNQSVSNRFRRTMPVDITVKRIRNHNQQNTI